MHVIASFRDISLAYLVIAVSQTVPKQKKSTQTDQRRPPNAMRLGAARIPFWHQKSAKNHPPHFVLYLQSKTNANIIPEENVAKMIIGMTFKVYNSICIAIIHTYITYHILYIHIHMHVDCYSFTNMSIRIGKHLCFLMYIPMYTYTYKKIMGDWNNHPWLAWLKAWLKFNQVDSLIKSIRI